MHLQILGGLALEGSGFNRPKPLLMLAYLAIEGPTSRRELADLFFMSTRDPRDSLSTALRYLRRESPDLFEVDGDRIQTSLRCDALELIKQFDAGQFEEALITYGGPFLKGLSLELDTELEEWVYGTREVLAGKAREAYLQMAESRAAKGEFRQAARLAEEAYFLPAAPEPEPSDFHRVYRLLIAANNTRAADVRQEATNFDIDLSINREEALARFRGPVGEATPHNLSARSTSFVGRDLELIEVARQLERPECRLLTIHGAGGIGKSRLAIQAAFEQLKGSAFKDGVFFVQLEALTSPDLIPSSTAEALGLDPQGQQDILAQVKQHIGQKQFLLLLDNYEHLIAGATLAAELLRACPNLKILITSRERLDLEEEWVFSLEGLSVSENDVDVFEKAQRFDALHLFAERAKRARLDFSLTQENLQAAQELCRLVGGSPLGIELAAVWIRMMPLEEIVSDLKQNLNVLATSTRNMVDRHQSIRAAFEHSWKLLTPKEQESLRKLSVFRGGFRREAAAEVTGATLPVLSGLADKSLLRVTPKGRYDFHVLLHQFAREKLASNTDEQIRLQRGHSAYYFHFLELRDEMSYGQHEALKSVEEEIANVREAWFWAVTNHDIEKLRRSTVIRLYYERRARFREGIELFAHAVNSLSRDSQVPDVTLGILLIHQSKLYFRIGNYQKAEELSNKGMEILRSSDEHAFVAEGLNTLGILSYSTGSFEQGKRYFKEALEVAEKLHDEGRIGSLSNNLAMTEQSQGDYHQARIYHEKALAIHKRQDNPFGIAASLRNLGELSVLMGEADEALATLGESLQLARKIKYELFLPQILIGLADAHVEIGNHSIALSFGQEALELTEKIGDQSVEAVVLVTLGRINLELNNHAEATSLLRRSLGLSLPKQNTIMMLEALLWLSRVLIRQNLYEKAAKLLSLINHHPFAEGRLAALALEALNAVGTKASNRSLLDVIEEGKHLNLEEVVRLLLEESIPLRASVYQSAES